MGKAANKYAGLDEDTFTKDRGIGSKSRELGAQGMEYSKKMGSKAQELGTQGMEYSKKMGANAKERYNNMRTPPPQAPTAPEGGKRKSRKSGRDVVI